MVFRQCSSSFRSRSFLSKLALVTVVAFKHSLFDLPCDHFLDCDNAVPISVDSINGQTRRKTRKIG
jgi:hypothetical protein